MSLATESLAIASRLDHSAQSKPLDGNHPQSDQRSIFVPNMDLVFPDFLDFLEFKDFLKLVHDLANLGTLLKDIYVRRLSNLWRLIELVELVERIAGGGYRN